MSDWSVIKLADDRLKVTHLMGKKLDEPVIIEWAKTDNDKEILSYARKIRKYCKTHRCDEECDFCKGGFCVLADSDGNTCDWVIPKPRKTGD